VEISPYTFQERIYVVVPEVVFNPLRMVCDSEGAPISVESTESTIAVVQPKGRMGAQMVHVGRFMGMATAEWQTEHTLVGGVQQCKVFTAPFKNYTTITLAARDSFELFHVYFLLVKAGITVYTFEDTNPEYGEGSVVTALATEPISWERRLGILDYLPLLWQGE